MNTLSINNFFELGIALSAEKDRAKLFGRILNEALELTGADAGTIYILDKDYLEFNYMITKSKGVNRSSDRGEISIPPVKLGRTHVCACCAIDKKLINIPDIYDSKEYDFSGAQNYDSLNDYRTKSMLVVPMLDETGDCIGVLQLINDTENGKIVAFDEMDEQVIRAFASFAAISLNNRILNDSINELLKSFVTIMVEAIDTRSPYNANHTKSMVKYGERFLKWASENNAGFRISEKDKAPYIMSIWLHDIGKLLIPLEVMDKATRLGDKLDKVLNRITIAILMERIDGSEEKIEKLKDAREFILSINESGFLADDKKQKLDEIAKMNCKDENGNIISVLQPDELDSLSIVKGTLTSGEREIIQSHVEYTDKMLSGMNFSGRYRIVPDIAGAHHEFIDGSGYPKGKKEEELSKETRLLTILDIFDALIAEDRPYKPPLPIEKAFGILDNMAEEGKLDKDILKMFKESKVWEDDLWEKSE